MKAANLKWEYSYIGQNPDYTDKYIALIKTEDSYFTVSTGKEVTKLVAENNAKLIAAAPEMLEFITQIAKIAEMGNLNGNKLYLQATELIKKATE